MSFSLINLNLRSGFSGENGGCGKSTKFSKSQRPQ
jgi:hypothetical protein